MTNEEKIKWLTELNTSLERFLKYMKIVNLYTSNDLENEDLLQDYSLWLSNVRDTLPYDERKKIISRIYHKEIKRRRKLIEDFNSQFE